MIVVIMLIITNKPGPGKDMWPIVSFAKLLGL